MISKVKDNKTKLWEIKFQLFKISKLNLKKYKRPSKTDLICSSSYQASGANLKIKEENAKEISMSFNQDSINQEMLWMFVIRKKIHFNRVLAVFKEMSMNLIKYEVSI